MIKRINVDRLKLGMFVVELDRPWIETPFLFKRFNIKSPQQIEKLKEYCSYVHIDTAKGLDDDGAADVAQVDGRILEEMSHLPEKGDNGRGRGQQSFDAEVRQALEVRNKAKRVVDQMMEDVRLGKSIDSDDARDAVENIMDSITRNREALVCLTQLKNRDEYTSIHSMNVCILCIAFARHLGLNEEQIRIIGLGALLHDLGKMRVPLEILNKPGRLTAEEFDIMKGHVLLGAAILKESAGIPPRALRVVLEHHERFKGGGYPRGLAEDQISVVGQLAAIVDVYDAITSDRVYHDHMDPHEAIKRMYEWSERDFNRAMLEKFIKCVGIYPLGSLVEVNKAEIGFVISSNATSALKPDVLLVMNGQRRPYSTPQKISLTEKSPTSQKDKWVITHVLDAVEEGVRIDSFVQPSENA